MPQVGCSPGDSAPNFRSLPNGKKAPRDPSILPWLGSGGWQKHSPSSQPAVPRGPPDSLFRHVLQLQVVHLQLSPQRRFLLKRKGRAADMSVKVEGHTGVPQAIVVPGAWGAPWTEAGRECEEAAENHPRGEDHPVVPPVTVHGRKLGLHQHPQGYSLRCILIHSSGWGRESVFSKATQMILMYHQV